VGAAGKTKYTAGKFKFSKTRIKSVSTLTALIFSLLSFSALLTNCSAVSNIANLASQIIPVSMIKVSRTCPQVEGGGQVYPNGRSFGLAFDGANLWVSCYGTGTGSDLYRVNPKTGAVTADYRIEGGLGALAFNASQGIIYAGWGGGGNIGKILILELTGDGGIKIPKLYYSKISVCQGNTCPKLDDGLAYNESNDMLYVSQENSNTITAIHPDRPGIIVQRINWVKPAANCYTSGLAVGGNTLFETADGCSKVLAVNRLTNQTRFTINTPGDEAVTCDPVTFDMQGRQVIWTKDDLSQNIYAYSVPWGTCGTGGFTATSNNFIYAGLGDSYSSGEGVPPFYPGTADEKTGDECHRSVYAYSQLLARASGARSYFWACSGAQTKDVLTEVYQTEPPQIKEPGVSKNTSLLTISIGGNDAQFGPIALRCISDWVRLKEDCHGDGEWVRDVQYDIEKLGDRLVYTYQKIKKAVGPQTSIIVMGYPLIFSTNKEQLSCASFYLPADVIEWFNQLTEQLDEIIQKSAAIAGVNYVNPIPTFEQHGVCTKNPWMIGVSTTQVYSFHPNKLGQEAYYRALTSAIEAWRNSNVALNAEGFPLNPKPEPNP
jgi:hypothetical protein